MTERSAGELGNEAHPRVQVGTLVQIAALVRNELESIDRQEEGLRSDQAKETLHAYEFSGVGHLRRLARC